MTYFSLVRAKPDSKGNIPSTIDSTYNQYYFNSKNFPLIWGYRESDTDRDIIGYYAYGETKIFSIELRRETWASLEIESHFLTAEYNNEIVRLSSITISHISIYIHCERLSSFMYRICNRTNTVHSSWKKCTNSNPFFYIT